jgi:hypothetical protein
MAAMRDFMANTCPLDSCGLIAAAIDSGGASPCFWESRREEYLCPPQSCLFCHEHSPVWLLLAVTSRPPSAVTRSAKPRWDQFALLVARANSWPAEQSLQAETQMR